MSVVYAALTEAYTLMLDENGVCEWAAPTGRGHVPDRIVGAQFVASLDVDMPGALVGEPREGVPMLFATISRDQGGHEHISLIRTAPLIRFDDRRTESGIIRTNQNPIARSLRPSLEDIAPRGRRSSAPPPRSIGPASNNYTPPPAPMKPKGAPDANFRPTGMAALPSDMIISSRRTARHRR
jgi:hypothetical protein